MAAETPTGLRIGAGIAGLVVVVALVVGGYFAFFQRPAAPPAEPGAPSTAEAPAGASAPSETAEIPAPSGESPAAGSPAGTSRTAETPDGANAPAAAGTTAATPGSAQAPSLAEAPAAGDVPATADSSAPPPAAGTTAPATPAAGGTQTAETPAAEGSASAAPSFDVVRVEPSGDTVAAGTAAPNATVEVLDGATPIGKGEANARGEWAIIVDKPLEPGTHDLSIRTTSPDKKTEMLSEQRVAIEVPTVPKGAPLVVLNSPDSPSRVLQNPGASAPKLAATEPGAANGEGAADASASPGVTVDAVEFEAGRIFIAGSAAMGGTVRIYVDGVAIGDAVVDANGRWMIAARRSIAPGRHVVRADQIDRATGDVIVRAEVPFDQVGDVASLLPMTEGGGSGGAASTGDLPAPQSVMIRRGDNLWTISRRLYGHGVRFSTIYDANSDQIRNPDLIYPGQVFMLPAGDSRWTN